jgi:phage terminase small subunit
MRLNARQERFVQHLVVGGMNATAAYKASGYAGKTDGTARAGASELLTNPNVKSRLAELQRQAAQKAVVTAESIADELDIAFRLAFENKQAAACVAASMGKAKLFGLIVDRAEVEQTIKRKPVVDPDAPGEMSLGDWQKKYGGSLIGH